MTTTDDALRAEVAAVADSFVELMRTFVRVRSRLLAAAQHDVEWSAHLLLRTLAAEGPMRSGSLAERLEADPSTVSRQVATLVKEGLLERRADPEDGRAMLLVPTERGREVIRDHLDIRHRHFGQMLADWSDDDLAEFARLLERFTTDFTCANSEWLVQRVAAVPGADAGPANDRSEGNT